MTETTRFLLQLIGPSFVIIAISVASSHKNYLNMVKEMDKNRLTLFVTGLITFITGLAILINHNLYGSIGEIIVTIFGWIAMIKGVLLIIMPGTSVKIGKSMSIWLKYVPVVWMVLGSYIWWLGFFS